MRIGLLAPLVTPIREPQLGGSQALLADLARGLAERDHDVEVLAATGSEIDGIRVVDTGVDPEILRDALFRAEGETHRATPAVREAFARAYDLVRGAGYDLVHAHAFDAPAIELAGDLGCPVVHTLHLPPDDGIARAVRHAEATVACVSRSQMEAWARLVRVGALLPDGVPSGRIPWSASGGEAALFAGRFSPEKGAGDAIGIARAAGVPIVVVGSPYDPDYAAAHVEPHRGEPGVEIRDALPREELWELMAASRTVLCPVAWEEPFGLVAAEAQAAGTPVIAYPRGGLREIVRDGETGALVADAEAAAAALRDADRYDRMTCRRHAERSLGLERTLDAHEDFYERIVAR